MFWFWSLHVVALVFVVQNCIFVAFRGSNMFNCRKENLQTFEKHNSTDSMTLLSFFYHLITLEEFSISTAQDVHAVTWAPSTDNLRFCMLHVATADRQYASCLIPHSLLAMSPTSPSTTMSVPASTNRECTIGASACQLTMGFVILPHHAIIPQPPAPNLKEAWGAAIV